MLRQLPQLALLSVLTPAWLMSEWMVAAGSLFEPQSTRVAAAGVFLCALSYLTAVRGPTSSDWRRTLQWIGGLALLPAASCLAFASSGGWWRNELLPARPALMRSGGRSRSGCRSAWRLALRRREALLSRACGGMDDSHWR